MRLKMSGRIGEEGRVYFKQRRKKYERLRGNLSQPIPMSEALTGKVHYQIWRYRREIQARSDVVRWSAFVA